LLDHIKKLANSIGDLAWATVQRQSIIFVCKINLSVFVYPNFGLPPLGKADQLLVWLHRLKILLPNIESPKGRSEDGQSLFQIKFGGI
jgi:hypothetical protein